VNRIVYSDLEKKREIYNRKSNDGKLSCFTRLRETDKGLEGDIYLRTEEGDLERLTNHGYSIPDKFSDDNKIAILYKNGN